MDQASSVSTKVEFRADWFAYFALDGIFGLFCLAFTYFTFRELYLGLPQSGIAYYAIISYAIFLIIIFVIRSYSVKIENGVLSYRFLLTHHAVKLSAIKNARIDVRVRNVLKLLQTKPSRPAYALVIESANGAEGGQFEINMKFLSRKDLRALVALLADKVSDKSKLDYTGLLKP